MFTNWGWDCGSHPGSLAIIGLTPVPGLFVNRGWGTGGFKATPGSGNAAGTIVINELHPIAAPFGLDRNSAPACSSTQAAAAAVSH